METDRGMTFFHKKHGLNLYTPLVGILTVLYTLWGVSSPASDDIIRVGLATEPISLDPRQATDAVSSRLCRLLYQRLVDLNENYRAVPSLTTWEQLSPTHYRFFPAG